MWSLFTSLVNATHIVHVLFCKEFDFHVRWPGVKLLTALLKNQGVQVQGVILVSPMGELLLSAVHQALSGCHTVLM